MQRDGPIGVVVIEGGITEVRGKQQRRTRQT